MGMYTELILGCSLKKKTPKKVIDRLNRMVDIDCTNTANAVMDADEDVWLLQSTSYYFGVNRCCNKLWFNPIWETWHISARCNLKNYRHEIENFLEWLRPYIEYGSGIRDFYAIVTYEEALEPTIYYLHSKEEVSDGWDG